MSGESLRLGDSQEARDFAKRNLLCHPGRSAAESRDLRTAIGTVLIADGTANGELGIPDQVRDDEEPTRCWLQTEWPMASCRSRIKSGMTMPK